MSVSLEQFRQQVIRNSLISEEDLAVSLQELPEDPHSQTAEQLAQLLVRQNRLTAYQARQILSGRGKALIFGNYLVLDKVGQGGMGIVLRGRHRRMHRDVAIKVLPAAMVQDEAAIARFQREVVAAAQLMHPNIVAAYDADEVHGQHILVMEYVDGRDLSSIVRQNGPLPVTLAIDCVLQAACGLEFAHRRGVIHRDIKPANLLLDKEGTVKVLDMGLARFSEAAGDVGTQAELTGTGIIMGTVDYMSPEQALSTKSADARSDIYSLGITLYYLITGQPAYAGETLTARLLAHQTAPIPSMRNRQSSVPEKVQAIFEKMVAKNPDDRYAGMTELIADLETCRSDQSLKPLHVQIAGFGDTSTGREGGFRNTLDAENASASPPTRKATASASQAGSLPQETTIITRATAGTMPSIPVKSDQKILLVRKRPTVGRRVLTGAGIGLAGLLAIGTFVFRRASHPLPEVAGLPEASASSAAVTTPPSSLVAPPLALAPFDTRQAQAHQAAWAQYLGLPVKKIVELPGGGKMDFLLIPPGEFQMGSTEEEQKRFPEYSDTAMTNILASERPRHQVQISKPYYLGQYEVTQSQWQALMGDISSKHQNSSLPIDYVSWNEAIAFTERFTQQCCPPGMQAGLPTEAQWENACRAGTQTAWSCGDDVNELKKYAWYDATAKGVMQPVGTLLANPWGLHDMHGNVLEWCFDSPSSTFYRGTQHRDPVTGDLNSPKHICRGGSADMPAYWNRSAFRVNKVRDLRNQKIGLRLAMSIDIAKVKASQSGRTKIGNSPAFQIWVTQTQKLPPDQQVEAVSKKLKELNPAFDGKLTGWDGEPSSIRDGKVTDVKFNSDGITDLSPLQGFPSLRRLNISGQGQNQTLRDLSPLQGMRLTELVCIRNLVDDLSPLHGMRLESLYGGKTHVSDLKPLEGMPLVLLDCGSTWVSDLTPVKKLPLKRLWLMSTNVSDLTPLAGLNLNEILFTPKNMTKGMDVLREMKTLQTIGTDADNRYSYPAAEFWKKYDAGEFGAPIADNKPAGQPAPQ